jgi:hypothetical protein
MGPTLPESQTPSPPRLHEATIAIHKHKSLQPTGTNKDEGHEATRAERGESLWSGW